MPNITHEFTYDLIFGGKSIAEIDGRCVLHVSGRDLESACIVGAHDIELKYCDWAVPRAPGVPTDLEEGFISSGTTKDVDLEYAIKAWLEEGAGHDNAMETVMDKWAGEVEADRADRAIDEHKDALMEAGNP